jgi:hypothetical protein
VPVVFDQHLEETIGCTRSSSFFMWWQCKPSLTSGGDLTSKNCDGFFLALLVHFLILKSAHNEVIRSWGLYGCVVLFKRRSMTVILHGLEVR